MRERVARNEGVQLVLQEVGPPRAWTWPSLNALADIFFHVAAIWAQAGAPVTERQRALSGAYGFKWVALLVRGEGSLIDATSAW